MSAIGKFYGEKNVKFLSMHRGSLKFDTTFWSTVYLFNELGTILLFASIEKAAARVPRDRLQAKNNLWQQRDILSEVSTLIFR